MRTFLLVFFGLTLTLCDAQETLQLKEGQSSPSARIKDVSWIQGHWKGEAFGGVAEELWSPPEGNTMMFVFRLLHEGKVSFYEVGHIKEMEGTLLMQLKHFDSGLKGWEKKDETIDFKLIKLEENKVFFEGLTMEKINDHEMKVYVLLEDQSKKEEVLFKYQRVKS